MNFRQKYIGNRAFYRMLFTLVLPLMIQQGITNFVSLLDNVMVGGLGTVHMSGVSITNQLIFVYNLAIFGGLSGASIFGTQFYGSGDWKGMRDAFRFKLLFALSTGVIAVAVVVENAGFGSAAALPVARAVLEEYFGAGAQAGAGEG